jgi:glucose-1-phosphate cytidylyltransferase
MNAIILAGGKGSRLAPWHAPKCLLPINGVPIIHRLLTHLFGDRESARGVQRAVVCIGYRGSDVRASLRELGWTRLVDCWDAGEDAPMGARLLQMRGAAGGPRTLICYGDELADVDVKQLLAAHEDARERGRLVTFAASKQKLIGGAAMYAEDEDGHPCQVRIEEDYQQLVNIGFAVVETSCWDQLQATDGLSGWINRVSAQHSHAVGVYKHHGKRATVNSLADLQYAEEMWK